MIDCEHTDRVEITTHGDPAPTWVCAQCGTVLDAWLLAKPAGWA